MSVESVMPFNHLILGRPLLLLPSILPSIRVFSNESVLCIRWPKDWSFSFSISPSNEYSGLISFRMDWLDLLAAQGTLKSLLQHHSSKVSILWCQSLLQGIFPTQGLNPGLPHCRQILYQQSHKGSPPKSVKWSEVAQSCLTLWNPMDCSLPGSSIHGVFQAIILEWVATSFSRGSSQPRDRTQFSCIVDRRFTAWATRKTMFLTVHCVSNLGLSFIYSCGS